MMPYAKTTLPKMLVAATATVSIIASKNFVLTATTANSRISHHNGFCNSYDDKKHLPTMKHLLKLQLMLLEAAVVVTKTK